MAIHYHQPLDRTFHALGDGTRRRMLSMLAREGALSANELGEPFDIAQPTVSKHLKVLEQAGLIRREIEGRTHRFELQPQPMQEAKDWIGRHQRYWEGTLQRLDDFVQAMDATEDSDA